MEGKREERKKSNNTHRVSQRTSQPGYSPHKLGRGCSWVSSRLLPAVTWPADRLPFSVRKDTNTLGKQWSRVFILVMRKVLTIKKLNRVWDRFLLRKRQLLKFQEVLNDATLIMTLIAIANFYSAQVLLPHFVLFTQTNPFKLHSNPTKDDSVNHISQMSKLRLGTMK